MESTFFRVVKERKGECRLQAPRGPARARPVLKAEAVNHLWCWDISWLCTPVNGKYFYFYSVLDVFSRKIVAFDVRAKEDVLFARQMFAKAFQNEAPWLPGLVLHQDNGQPMKHASMRHLMERQGVIQSFSRPHTSNDNAFAESLFATFKGRLGYPEYFKTLEEAYAFCDRTRRTQASDPDSKSNSGMTTFGLTSSKSQRTFCLNGRDASKTHLDHTRCARMRMEWGATAPERSTRSAQ